jgi:hypothetical protein
MGFCAFKPHDGQSKWHKNGRRSSEHARASHGFGLPGFASALHASNDLAASR